MLPGFIHRRASGVNFAEIGKVDLFFQLLGWFRFAAEDESQKLHPQKRR
ncbi:hypothetical protein DSM3645_25669 [Blastopirellula marina DSM 3645]|uniref:Uncharacterized protein n=1 Tax=Blastopirellula marina DSM 3645 TaxID=314230 RepID=A4A2C0_9BACT|nr:hypothetical protein DSM3645_25669 [Blastopirellula marina DSM 3645]